jgi:hypothetical protein
MENTATVTIMRDLIGHEIAAVIEDMRSYPEDRLWWVPAGISNSGGVLAQHLIGNLNHFIGEGLGNTGYERHRDLEFGEHTRSKQEIVSLLESTHAMVVDVVGSLDDNRLADLYPISAPMEGTILGFLVYLYRHLAYHHGQINYLRRIASASE